jgi:hypothetical protein
VRRLQLLPKEIQKGMDRILLWVGKLVDRRVCPDCEFFVAKCTCCCIQYKNPLLECFCELELSYHFHWQNQEQEYDYNDPTKSYRWRIAGKRYTLACDNDNNDNNDNDVNDDNDDNGYNGYDTYDDHDECEPEIEMEYTSDGGKRLVYATSSWSYRTIYRGPQ